MGPGRARQIINNLKVKREPLIGAIGEGRETKQQRKMYNQISKEIRDCKKIIREERIKQEKLQIENDRVKSKIKGG